jgi:DNA-binding PadR family transcriptional regulator
MANTPIREPTLYVLSALAAGPLHGYAIIKAVEELSDGRLKLRAGTLYGALARLQADGFVAFDGTAKEGGPERRIFSLTTSGARLLADELDRLEANAAMGRSQLRRATS